jgi:hypothetical protein
MYDTESRLRPAEAAKVRGISLSKDNKDRVTGDGPPYEKHGRVRYNRRFHRHVSFETVLGLAAHRGPETYRDIVNRDADSPSGASERSTTYRSP